MHFARRSVGWFAALAAVSFAAPPLAAQTALWRMNCGGSAMPASAGPPFAADQPYAPGGGGYEGGSAVGDDVAGTMTGPLDDPLHQVNSSARTGWSAYRFDVPSGSYAVRLHFAEVDLDYWGPTLRVFDVAIEGALALDEFDVAARYGLDYAGQVVRRVEVADGRLDVVALPGPHPALLSAIEVWALPAVPGAPLAASGLTAKDGYHRTILKWDPSTDPLLGGFQVLRASSAAGPFASIATVGPAPASYLDDGAPLGQPAFYRVRALDLLGLPSGASGVASATARDSASSSLPVYRIEVAPADLAVIDKKILVDPKYEVPGKFTYGGKTWDVEVRYRGGASRTAPKKSWKVKFPAGDPFQGRSDLNLKAHFLDAALVREPASGEVFEDAGHPVYRQRDAHLVVNGEYRGVFDEVERIDAHYLEARARGADVVVYDCSANLSPLPAPADYEAVYEKTTHEESGYADLIALVQFLNDPATDALDIARDFDVDQFLGHMAALEVVGHSGQFGHNYFLLHDLALGRWEAVTWDNDRGWHVPDVPLWGVACPGCTINVLLEKLIVEPSFLWRYRAKLEELLQGAAAPAALFASVDQAHARVLVDALADPFKQGWEQDGPFLGGPADMKGYAALRVAFVQSQLTLLPPVPQPTSVWLNELAASNATGPVDEQGEHEDWLELYNATGAAVDVGNWCLTDDLSKPALWRLPAGTSVPAGGRVIVWLDKEPADGPLHADIKLAREGEELGLFAADGLTLLDFVHFGPQSTDVTHGRRTDGGAFWSRLVPTPLAPNDAGANLAPWITRLENAPALPGSSQSVEVACIAWDAHEPVSVQLFWRTAGGPFASLPMTFTGWQRHVATLPPQPSGTSVQFYAVATDALGLAATFPEAAPAELEGYTVADPALGPLRINEILADNDGVLADEAGEHEDCVELYNASTAPIALGGMRLTDDLGDPDEWTFPAGASVPAHGTVLVWADGETSQGPLHASFSLSKTGEEVGLFAPAASGGGLIDAVSFGPQKTDRSIGLLPDGGALGVSFLDPSPGARNVPAPGATRRYEATALAVSAVALSAASAPLLAQPFALAVTSDQTLAPGVLGLGLSPIALPLTGLGTLLALPTPGLMFGFATNAHGLASPSVLVPGDPSLAGLAIYAQALVLGDGFSNGVVATLGP